MKPHLIILPITLLLCFFLAGIAIQTHAQVTATPVPTVPPTLAPTAISTLVPGPFGGGAATWTPPPPDNRAAGNFFFRRPFAEQHTTYWARTYSYGSTNGGQLRIHHGLDFPNPTGTPILAAADGVIYYAGRDVAKRFGPFPDFYGITVVIEHNFMYSDGRHIYSLYGHLREAVVATGGSIKAGEVIGYVGATGVAFGPHLHFEVRVGDPMDYDGATLNPELWIAPYANTGVLAGRVMDVHGRLLEGVQVEVQSPGVYSFGYSYTGPGVNSDPVLGENFAIPDVPGGYQTVFVRSADGATRYRQMLYIWPGQVTMVNIYMQP